MEIANIPSPSGGDFNTEAFLARSPETTLLRLRVATVAELPSGLREIRLQGQDLKSFSYEAGQDLMIPVFADGRRVIRRRYTIRRCDPSMACLDLHVVTDSTGPGSRWALSLTPGDEVEAIGPRGKIFLSPSADWHLFFCDDVAVPAVAAMVESLPTSGRAIVFADVHVDDLKADAVAEVDWNWLPRAEAPAGSPEALVAAASSVELPSGVGQAYVFGEAAVVSQVSEVLAGRGVAVSSKAYWGRGRANASHGEPLKG
jgi:NADPH-dependent ferric siderophore reductase